jgi:hypothetical protein
MRVPIALIPINYQERPYHDDSTASRLLSEVKHRRARLVLRWGTTLESRVLFFLHFLFVLSVRATGTSFLSTIIRTMHRGHHCSSERRRDV